MNKFSFYKLNALIKSSFLKLFAKFYADVETTTYPVLLIRPHKNIFILNFHIFYSIYVSFDYSILIQSLLNHRRLHCVALLNI